VALGSLAAAYLWAVLAGYGLEGLEGAAEVSKASGFPAANVVFVASIGILVVAMILASLCVPARFRPSWGPLGSGGWAALYGVLGGVCFGVWTLIT
jgi:hypothetical protein